MGVATGVAIGIGVAWVGTQIVGMVQQGKANDIAQEGLQMTQDQVDQQLALQEQAYADLEAQREAYRQFEFENPYENMRNVFEGMENVYTGARNMYDEMVNPFANLENTFEDMQVSTVAADFQMQRGAQQRANIMAGLAGAAGSSGVAGLAQTLANQGSIQAQSVSADLARQQAQNEQLRARGAADIQRLEAQGAMQVQQAQLAEAARLQQLTLGEQARLDQLERQGAGQVQMAQLSGQQWVQEAEMQRQATLLGVAYGGAAGASAGVNQAYANQMNSMMTQASIYNQNAQMWYNMGGDIMSAGATLASDRKLKKNISKIGESPSGLNIYSFEYIDSENKEGVFQGVIADELESNAVFKRDDGYDMVDYNMIDVEFKKLK